jgi:PAS domain-containing protein
MAQKPIEVILMRQLASSLAMPIFIVDEAGVLVFYNEPAERVLGMRFEETGEMPAGEWATRWDPVDSAHNPIPPEKLPLTIAVAQQRPAHGEMWLRALDGTRRHIEATAFPLIRIGDLVVGAVVIFWESPS